MESKGFSVGTLLKKGWHLMKQHLGIFIVYLIVGLIFLGLAVFLPNAIDNLDWVWQLVILSVGLLLALVVHIGIFKISLKAVDGNSLGFADLLSGFNVVIQWIITSIFYAVIVLFPVGLAMLILVGLNYLGSDIATLFGVALVYLSQIVAWIFAVAFWFWPFVVIDKTSNPVKALRQSYHLSMGAKWDVYLMTVASGIVMFFGFLVLGIGAFVAFPTVMLAQAGMYRVLDSQTKS